MVQPVARAGATLQTIWFSGQFHGVIRAQTPIGSLMIIVEPRSSSNAKVFRTSIAVEKWPMPAGTCARCARAFGAPISSVTAAARSALRFSYSAMIRSMRAMRSSRVVRDQAGKARLAAATARSTSAASPSAIRPHVSSVAGFSTSSVFSATGSTQAPSI